MVKSIYLVMVMHKRLFSEAVLCFYSILFEIQIQNSKAQQLALFLQTKYFI